jgi:hypothetical protein
MAFDHETHTIDPATGFQVHKETGHRIGLDPAPHRPVSEDAEWPKWVTPHPSHVVRKEVPGAPDYLSVPAFPHFYVNRGDGEVTVLVHNEDEEKRAVEAVETPSDIKPESDGVALANPGIAPHLDAASAGHGAETGGKPADDPPVDPDAI